MTKEDFLSSLRVDRVRILRAKIYILSKHYDRLERTSFFL